MYSKYFEDIVKQTFEMVLLFDEKGEIFYSNQQANNDLAYPQGLVGLSISDVLLLDFKKEADGVTTEFLFGDNAQRTMAYRQNKTCFQVEAKIIPLPDGGYFCLLKDVAELEFLKKRVEQVQQEAEEALKVKSEFVANVTHELRTPVNGILGNTRVLFEDETDDSHMRTLKLIERGCNDMNNIINNILDFSKLEAGKFVLEEREFDFRNMIDYVKANHNPKNTEKGLQFFVTVSPEIPELIVGDELRIVQILNNLLSNATKFTSMGRITLEVLKTAQMNRQMELFFMVNDTGIGIDRNDSDKLFKSFSQVDASVSRKYGGTGLGLNICKQLVELMNGSISVESEVGKGTMFSFSIWVDIPESVMESVSTKVDTYRNATLESALSDVAEDMTRIFGTKENIEEINNVLSKLVLCVEMENWEKAEMFVEMIKQLTEGAQKEVKTAALRLKMAVQKGDYDKTISANEALKELL